MELDELILVSVDDHVVEPPEMFAGRLPAKFADQFPVVTRRDDGTEIWRFDGKEATNIGLNAVAGRPVEEYGIEPTSFAEIRPGCWPGPRVGPRVGRRVGCRCPRVPAPVFGRHGARE